MSLSIGLVISEYRHYDYEKSGTCLQHVDTVSVNSIMSQYESLPPPPSYSAVLAEKQQCATWDERLSEMNIMLNSLRQTINDTRTIIQTFQYCCIKLEHTNRILLTDLQQKMTCISEIKNALQLEDDEPDQLYQKKTNESLERMNQTLLELIEEAEMSLNTRLVLYADPYLLRKSRSCPKFTTKRTDHLKRNSVGHQPFVQVDKETVASERQMQLQQQRRRYFHSQWKLATAMKQLVQTVQQTSQHRESNSFKQSFSRDPPVVHHHIHHHHYHYVHQHDKHNITATRLESIPEINVSPVAQQRTRSNPVYSSSIKRGDNSGLTSLFKYALQTAGIIQEPSYTPKLISKNIKNSIKMRTMFVATVILLQKFNTSILWKRRSDRLISRWNKVSKQRYNLWIKNSNLVLLIMQLIALGKK